MSYNQVIAAVIAVYFTALIFEAPKSLRIYIGLLGGIGWFAYLFFIGKYDYIIASYLSSFIIAFSSHLAARKFKVPVTVFFIPSFFPLVPGAKMYQAVYSYITNNPTLGNKYLLETLFISGMIALAILTVDSIFRIYYQNFSKKQSSSSM